MLYHYIKIAFRNLLKYKLQSFICIVGLAIGFTSFALSSLWIRLGKTQTGSITSGWNRKPMTKDYQALHLTRWPDI